MLLDPLAFADTFPSLALNCSPCQHLHIAGERFQPYGRKAYVFERRAEIPPASIYVYRLFDCAPLNLLDVVFQ